MITVKDIYHKLLTEKQEGKLDANVSLFIVRNTIKKLEKERRTDFKTKIGRDGRSKLYNDRVYGLIRHEIASKSARKDEEETFDYPGSKEPVAITHGASFEIPVFHEGKDWSDKINFLEGRIEEIEKHQQKEYALVWAFLITVIVTFMITVVTLFYEKITGILGFLL